jgi:hypothetical protein
MTVRAGSRRYSPRQPEGVHPFLEDYIVDFDLEILHFWCPHHEKRLLMCSEDCEHRICCPLYNPRFAGMPR